MTVIIVVVCFWQTMAPRVGITTAAGGFLGEPMGVRGKRECVGNNETGAAAMDG